MHCSRAVLSLFALFTVTSTLLPTSPRAQIAIGVSIRVAPPILPVYVQPVIPGPGYIWVPGYWAWDGDAADYYWVPGTWVLAPTPGLLWTPGYWGWRDGLYVWNAGYWGPRIGFYGGINYGCGYTGIGFQGGYWRGGVFMYNRSVTNIGSVQITNVYSKTVINNTTINNVSFNGGKGGTAAHPTAEEQAAAQDKHVPATDMQTKHQQVAGSNHASFASVNGGHPAVAATATAGLLAGAGIVAAKGAKKLPNTPNTLKSSVSHPDNPTSAAKLMDSRAKDARTPKQFGKSNFPSGASGQKYMRTVTNPKGPQSAPKNAGPARKPQQPGKKPDQK